MALRTHRPIPLHHILYSRYQNPRLKKNETQKISSLQQTILHQNRWNSSHSLVKPKPRPKSLHYLLHRKYHYPHCQLNTLYKAILHCKKYASTKTRHYSSHSLVKPRQYHRLDQNRPINSYITKIHIPIPNRIRFKKEFTTATKFHKPKPYTRKSLHILCSNHKSATASPQTARILLTSQISKPLFPA